MQGAGFGRLRHPITLTLTLRFSLLCVLHPTRAALLSLTFVNHQSYFAFLIDWQIREPRDLRSNPMGCFRL
jgi:hypothetical protein